MLKDEVNREEELKELGWSPEDLRRYAELWEYRKRWGAANLEREERIFLKKADNALPALTKKRGGSAADVKQVEEKLHYKWIELYKIATDDPYSFLYVKLTEPDKRRMFFKNLK